MELYLDQIQKKVCKNKILSEKINKITQEGSNIIIGD